MIGFENGGGFEDFYAGFVDIVGDNVAGFAFGQVEAVVVCKLRNHADVLEERVLGIGKFLEIKRRFARKVFSDFHGFFGKSARKNKQAHNFDYADCFLFDVVHVFGRVEDAVRVFFVGAVVAQNEVETIVSVVGFLRDRGDGVVWSFVRERQNIDGFVAVCLPGFENVICESNHFFCVGAFDPDDAVVPVGNACGYAFKVRVTELFEVSGFHFRQNLCAALVVIVRKNAAADDRKRSVAADEIVREGVHEIGHTLK